MGQEDYYYHYVIQIRYISNTSRNVSKEDNDLTSVIKCSLVSPTFDNGCKYIEWVCTLLKEL